MGATMAKRKTSAEKARDEEEQSQLDNMLGGAFGDIESLEKPPEDVDTPADIVDETPAADEASKASEDTIEAPTGPPTGPPPGPPSGPPTGPPTGPPSGPPTGPPTGPPSGPPTGPPTGPPSGPPSGPPTGPPEDSPAEPPAPSSDVVEDAPHEEAKDVEAAEEPEESEASTEVVVEEPAADAPAEPPVSEDVPSESETTPVAEAPEEVVEQPPAPDQTTLDLLAEKEAELERLHMENARLRQSVVGATEVIEELEEPPMPPLVEDNIVIPPYIVSDFVRLGRQLDREHLVRATMGSLAMIHPEQPGVMISTRHMVTLPRMNERSLCAAPLGSASPRGAPTDWHALEVVLASVSVVTGGPAAVIHMHGPHTTAASCEKDLVLLTPIDEIGKQHIGKIIIVDPDPEHPEDYLRQVVEALNQGGMRCVVIRGNGAYAVGADFDQAWANAAMVEHSMQIHLLARQANLKT